MIITNKKPLNLIFKNLIFYTIIFSFIFLLSYFLIFNINPSFGPISNYNSGIYSGNLTVRLTNYIPHSEIRFTVDNRKPTKDSEIFSNPFQITSTTVLRAQAFRNGEPLGKESVYSYLIPEREISLPIVNLVVDHKDLFDRKKGIITNYSKTGWYRPAKFIYYEKNSKVPQVTLKSEIRIYGARSRSFPRKSFHVCFKEQNLNFKIFENSPETDYDCLTIRNSGNDYNSTFIRDALVHDITSDITDIYNQKSTSIILYLNNDYYGIYDIREPNNTNTLSLKYGGEKEDYSILYHFAPNEGEVRKDSGTKTDTNFYKDLLKIAQQDLSIIENRTDLEQHMDINNYFQYQIIQTFFKNYDYLIQNTKFYRFNGFIKEPDTLRDGRFRWLLYDTDVSFGFSVREKDIFYTIQGKADEDELEWPYLLFNSLIKNSYYKSLFISMYVDYLNSSLKSDFLLPYVDKFSKNIEPEVPFHIKRWENFVYPFENDKEEYRVPMKSKKDWEENILEIKDFIKMRNTQVYKELNDNFSLGGTYTLRIENSNPEMGYIKINTLEIKEKKWEGVYFNTLEPVVEAIPNEGFTFEGWEVTTKDFKKPKFMKQ